MAAEPDWNLSLIPLSVGEDSSNATSHFPEVIQANHRRVSRNLEEFVNRRRSFLHRPFPTKLDKVLADSQLNMACNECELNERLLKLATDLKFEAAREGGDAWIKSLKVDVRQRFIAFITERYAALQLTIEQHRVAFGSQMKQRYETLDTYRDMPALACRYEKSINDDIESYLDWLDQLLARFRGIVQERVADFERPSLPRS
jgi:ribosomal protein L44E